MDKPTDTEGRCAEHNLAIGPEGTCVLCRREQPVPAAPGRWLLPVVLAASVGTAVLSGFALGRRHGAPVVEATAAEPAAPVAPAIDESPVAVLEDPPAEEPLPAPVAAAPAPAPPQPTAPPRDYLDEAWRQIPKGNLYDEAPRSPPPQPVPVAAPPPPRPRMVMGGYGRHVHRHSP